MTSIKLLP